MGEASAMGMFVEDGMVPQMLRPYSRSHLKESIYLSGRKPFAIL